MFNEMLNVHPEVKDAIANREPIVALESTIISHGMPYPDNLNTAIEIEKIIRDEGAVPATIALHQGKIQVGIDESTREILANDKTVSKASRRDLAFVLSQQSTASTTVAATMFCAHLAGVHVFVTGGIGGVHRNVSEHFDISADLLELAQTPVTVVCSGAKSILDLPKTLEVLETNGVPVIGYRTNEFPAFYSHSSGIPLLHQLDDVQAIASLMHSHHKLYLKNGIIIANPIPIDTEIPSNQIAPVIEQAQRDAKNIKGKEITPFLLKRISELTEGQSLKANISLIRNNARLGAQISTAYSKFG